MEIIAICPANRGRVAAQVKIPASSRSTL